MAQMRALVREKGRVSLRDVPQPVPTGSDQVLIRVHTAGICRTDLAVIRGQLPTPEPLIPGHEFAGTVVQDVAGFQAGQRVTAMPLLPCGHCHACQQGSAWVCVQGQMLGLAVDGIFAEYVCLPAAQVYPVPPALSWEEAAFAEPVAAAAAIFKADLDPARPGVLLGKGRIASLSARLLALQGFEQVLQVEQPQDLPPACCDWLIETGLPAQDLRPLLRALRPSGLLVLKSRHLPHLSFDPMALIQQELRLQGVYYAPFGQALHWLMEYPALVAGLLGSVWPCEDWQAALQAAESGEAQKIFLRWV